MLTRPLGGRSTGRITVLRTHARALSDAGCAVTVAVVTPEPPEQDTWTGRWPTVHVRSPSLPRILLSSVRALLSRSGRSLNECLFVDRRVRDRVRELAVEMRADLVVLDSLRLAGCVDDLGVPAVVDLDDLLSARYADLRERGAGDPVAVLGFARERVPARVQRPVGRIAVLLLGREARTTARREIEAAATATVSLVGRQEVDVLSARTGRPVEWLPPAVALPDAPVVQQDGLVFLGGLDYLPNLQSLVFHRDEVLPHLDPSDPRHVLHVIGTCPDDARRQLDVPGIELHGYADDLHEALSRRLLLAPLVAEGGIKLKVLDALAHGLPVVGTEAAVAGLPLPAELRLVAQDGAGLAQLVRELVDDPDRCVSLGLAGRALVAEHFVAAAAARRWSALVDRLTGATPPKPGG